VVLVESLASRLSLPSTLSRLSPQNVAASLVAATFAAGGTLAALPDLDTTLSSKVGRFQFTNVNSIAADATDTVTIINTAAGSSGLVGLECPAIAVSSIPIVGNVVWTAGVSVAITIRNVGSAATGAASAFTFTWISFN